MPEDEEEEEREVQQFGCGLCFGDFYLAVGIRPAFCPHCGKKVDEVLELAEGSD